MPAFLLKDHLFFVDVGIKDRIQIHIHQIAKILVIAAGHRIHRFIRIGHGIQEGIQGSLGQFHKGVLYRILSRTAEHAVLNDMGHASRVCGWRTKTDIKDLILVVIGKKGDPGAGLFMPQDSPLAVKIRYIPLQDDLIAFQ